VTGPTERPSSPSRGGATRRLRRAAALVLASACVATSAAPPAPRPMRRERIELRVTLRPWEAGGAFQLATSSGRTDQGIARDTGGFSATGGAVRRILEGEKGTLVLRLQGQPRPGQPPLFGRWTVASGTGAYAGMTGSGTFTAMGSGDRRGGSPYELQFLVGHVLHGW
jgi:hypothetical protein